MTRLLLLPGPASAHLAAGAAIVVLAGLTWLLRGGKSAVRACLACGAAELAWGLAAGQPLTVAGGTLIVILTAGVLFYLRGTP